MLHNMLTGLPVMLLCLILQALFVVLTLRLYLRLRPQSGKIGPVTSIMLLSLVMSLMLFGNFIQMALWAVLYLLLGEFTDFSTAVYFSGVTFSTVGYGDVVLSEHWRLLSPLEAGNGILMFGVSTAMMTATLADIIKRHNR
ncbi:two pore domain potassium channel family protein [Pseudomonas sp. FFUP_PS_473]|uniref:potassium channel family protein n=1 Tax=unclassified Pseudomonas TaxID=196821 RepID=UPI000C19BB26|nr:MULTISPECIES: potassium channel family protein [unclassified Pseudomonas]ATR82349.1 transporter [Pseudomonas sp. HLS-6]MEE3635596.1 potassium channel family protein [Pseudomonas sp. AL 58]PLP93167.1 two pore domain potassium channel family protein [Pseudomonas sp. FFUP_PS_473]WJM98871.1 potassium channel family protein [Pseudomonas defluvii]